MPPFTRTTIISALKPDTQTFQQPQSFPNAHMLRSKCPLCLDSTPSTVKQPHSILGLQHQWQAAFSQWQRMHYECFADGFDAIHGVLRYTQQCDVLCISFDNLSILSSWHPALLFLIVPTLVLVCTLQVGIETVSSFQLAAPIGRIAAHARALSRLSMTAPCQSYELISASPDLDGDMRSSTAQNHTAL